MAGKDIGFGGRAYYFILIVGYVVTPSSEYFTFIPVDYYYSRLGPEKFLLVGGHG